jgi:hypothetical protein
MLTVPGGAEELVAESKDEYVLYHLLAEVVVNTEHFLFLPIRSQSFLEFSGAFQVLAERFLDLPKKVIQLVSVLSP